MNNLSSYCELVDAKIRASDKDLPVLQFRKYNTTVKIYSLKKEKGTENVQKIQGCKLLVKFYSKRSSIDC